ncbi:hypothetical protein Tco_1545968, partial [Tanacetum coccineum]
GIINQLAGMGIKFEDEIQGLWLLGTLPDTWETFRTSLSNSAPDGVITMELAKGRGEVKVEARVTEVIIVAVLAKENLLMLNVITATRKDTQ